jgi:SAM-dependent methyltransferase
VDTQVKSEENMADPFPEILKCAAKPTIFEPGETHFWDDPHISKGMLEAHLDPDHDAASRKSAAIDQIVEHFVSSKLIKPGERVLDLGCGPGLYAGRLSRQGVKITGIDISQRSIDYARKDAQDSGLEIDYRSMNFLDISFDSEFDFAMQIYGELNTFSDEIRDAFLAKIHRALKPGGLFVFDVTTRITRMKYGLKNRWYMSEGGFWRPGRHLVLEQGFDYPENDTWLDQFIVADESGHISVYRCWFHDYTLSTITPVLEKAGFRIKQVWNDLAGTPYLEGGEWIAIAAQK